MAATEADFPTPANALKVVLVAACALIDADGRVLIAQRPVGKSMAGLWEFPGGKVEPGERPEETVIREMSEELGVTIGEKCLMPFTFASHSYPDFHLLMPLFLCRRWDGIPQAQENQAIAWVKPKDLLLNPGRYPMPPADTPLLPLLRDLR
jgi:8-oxo-dGTP diphosphatase